MLMVSSLTGTRGGRLLFTDLSFNVLPGDLLHITGKNGAGKTTLLEALAGIHPFSKGHLLFRENPLQPEDFLFLGPQHGFKAFLSAGENLAFWSKVYGGDKEALPQAISYFELNACEDIRYADLSTGQKQRLSLARLLLVDRPLWLLDEPFLGLDGGSSQKLISLFEGHRSKGGSLCLGKPHSC